MINQKLLNKLLLKCATLDNLDMVKLLIDTSSARGLERDFYYSTVLTWAATEGYIDVVEYMVENGARVNDKNLLGYTPLMCAFQEHNVEIAEYLINNGAIS